MKNLNVKFCTTAGCIATLYVVLTLISNVFGLASGAVQVRISEALCILPLYMKSAVPGLTVGCFLSNLIMGSPLPDVIFGSVATLSGAVFTRVLRKNKYVAITGPVISNTIIVPFVLKYAYNLDGAWWYMAATVFAGEVISCIVFGVILMKAIEKRGLLINEIN